MARGRGARHKWPMADRERRLACVVLRALGASAGRFLGPGRRLIAVVDDASAAPTAGGGSLVGDGGALLEAVDVRHPAASVLQEAAAGLLDGEGPGSGASWMLCIAGGLAAGQQRLEGSGVPLAAALIGLRWAAAAAEAWLRQAAVSAADAAAAVPPSALQAFWGRVRARLRSPLPSPTGECKSASSSGPDVAEEDEFGWFFDGGAAQAQPAAARDAPPAFTVGEGGADAAPSSPFFGSEAERMLAALALGLGHAAAGEMELAAAALLASGGADGSGPGRPAFHDDEVCQAAC